MQRPNYTLRAKLFCLYYVHGSAYVLTNYAYTASIVQMIFIILQSITNRDIKLNDYTYNIYLYFQIVNITALNVIEKAKRCREKLKSDLLKYKAQRKNPTRVTEEKPKKIFTVYWRKKKKVAKI